MEQKDPKLSTNSKSLLRIEGHRGAGYLENENTLQAFQRGVDLGLDGVELDVPY
jgi:glycerophosphoryl diester phosphodiesterase